MTGGGQLQVQLSSHDALLHVASLLFRGGLVLDPFLFLFLESHSWEATGWRSQVCLWARACVKCVCVCGVCVFSTVLI